MEPETSNTTQAMTAHRITWTTVDAISASGVAAGRSPRRFDCDRVCSGTFAGTGFTFRVWADGAERSFGCVARQEAQFELVIDGQASRQFVGLPGGFSGALEVLREVLHVAIVPEISPN